MNNNKDALEKLQEMNNKKLNLAEFSKGNVEAIFIGGAALFAYAFFRGKSLLPYTIAGMIIGGLISKKLN